MMVVAAEMAILRRRVYMTGGRVTRWKLSDLEARKLAKELEPTSFNGSWLEIYLKLIKGNMWMYGIPILVKPEPRLTVDSSTWTGR